MNDVTPVVAALKKSGFPLQTRVEHEVRERRSWNVLASEQELLGHASLAMTMRYAHLAPEHLRTAVSRLEGLTSSEPASPSAQASAQEPVETAGASQK